MLDIFSCACWPSACLLWVNVYLSLGPTVLTKLFIFDNWAVWAVWKFWKLIRCQLHCLLIFSPIMEILFSFCLCFPLLCKSFSVCCCCCQVASVVLDSVQPHRWQPTRLPRPWDSPGKNTGVGCHFLLQCMKVKSEREVAQLFPTLSDPMDCSPSGSSIHGIFQARVLEWGAIAFSGAWAKRRCITSTGPGD